MTRKEKQEIIDHNERTMEFIIGKRTARIYDPERAAEIITEIEEQFNSYK